MHHHCQSVRHLIYGARPDRTKEKCKVPARNLEWGGVRVPVRTCLCVRVCVWSSASNRISVLACWQSKQRPAAEDAASMSRELSHQRRAPAEQQLPHLYAALSAHQHVFCFNKIPTPWCCVRWLNVIIHLLLLFLTVQKKKKKIFGNDFQRNFCRPHLPAPCL